MSDKGAEEKMKGLTINIPTGNKNESSVDDLPLLTAASTLSNQSSGTSCDTPKNMGAVTAPADHVTPQSQVIPMTPLDREAKARELIAARGLSLDYDLLDDAQKKRAKQIQSADLSWSPSHDTNPNRFRPKALLTGDLAHETTFEDEWSMFLEALPEGESERWKKPAVFFDDAAIKNYLVIRRQAYKNCYMHAVAVFQHYLRCLRIGPHDHIMIDLSWYIREHFKKEELEGFIKTGAGGNSAGFFRRLTKLEDPCDLIPMTFARLKSENVNLFKLCAKSILDLFLEQKEPALISGFRISKEFKANREQLVFEGEVSADGFEISEATARIALHSLVLLGAFMDSDGMVWFLVQNFWSNAFSGKWSGRYFQVISAEYMASCRAVFHFLAPGRNPSLVDMTYEVVDAHYAETYGPTPEECDEYYEEYYEEASPLEE